jgi:pilus assembly protein CpaC
MRRQTQALIFILTLSGSATVVWAQPLAYPASGIASKSAPAESAPDSVRLLVGRSAVLDVGGTVTRVSLTSADVADALVTSSSQLLIHGKMPGTISMFVWDRAGALRRYEVVVQRDVARLSEQIRVLFPSEKINVQSNGKNIVLAGTVTNKDVVDQMVNVAAGFVDKREEVVSLLQLPSSGQSNQVLLRVRFAEVSRTALTQLGANFFSSPNGEKNFVGRTTTGQFAAPSFSDRLGPPPPSNPQSEGKLTFSDFLNVFLFNTKYNVGVVIQALQNRGLFQSLAEPNLVAESGKEASFLAGGEVPIPVAQASGGGTTISVQYKEFGIRLNFIPLVNGDRVHLKVRPEVSTLDFSNGVTLQGFRIPALSTRRTETELELNNGQTFAIAGLLNSTMNSTLQKIPGIGDIPVLGLLFQSKEAQKQRTELVVMITPEILPRESPGVTPSLPRTPEPYLPPLPDKKTVPPPPPAFGDRPGGTPSASGPPSATEPAPLRSRATTAANAVTALTPAGPSVQAQSPTAQAPAAPKVAERQLTDQEKKALERARKEEQQHAKEKAKTDERAKAEEAKRKTAEDSTERKRVASEQVQQKAEQLQQKKAAREQAKRDAEAAKRTQEETQKQLERDRERQKLLDQAASRLKAAQDAYDAEAAKTNKE